MSPRNAFTIGDEDFWACDGPRAAPGRRLGGFAIDEVIDVDPVAVRVRLIMTETKEWAGAHPTFFALAAISRKSPRIEDARIG